MSSAALKILGEGQWEDGEIKIRVRIQKADVRWSRFSPCEERNCSTTTVQHPFAHQAVYLGAVGHLAF